MRTERLNMLRRRLRRYYEAEDAILTAGSYTLEGMTLNRASLAQVRTMIAQLENEIKREEDSLMGRKRSRMRVVIPCDGMRYRP